jgi:hypothetical protein
MCDKLAVAQIALGAADCNAIRHARGMSLDECINRVISPKTRAIMFIVPIHIEERHQSIRH